MLDLDEVLVRAKAKRLLVNNCFQLNDGSWRANFRRRRKDGSKVIYYDLGTASTMEKAMVKAYRIASKAIARGVKP